ncbi:transglycosylase domain-containing protein [Paenibacillus polymyxa]|uniref:transglycosylase domain-containing protein n=1 Tax=Paenibacillus polymyxa TaxID=1406 RepID=UPI000F4D81E6|nr:transglycosylase domain-containing protein [Paenibacillus polymyxa]RPE02715.1 carboxypeptidase [Paenibacillus polymyxa]
MVEEKNNVSEPKPSRLRRTMRRLGRVIKWVVIIGFMGALFAGGTAAGYVASIVRNEPVRSRSTILQEVDKNAITGFAYFNDGSPIGQLRTEEDRRPVTFKEIPQLVIDAVIAIEDNHFYEHKGVDLSGTLRAVKQKALHESVQTGGSTLTQQLARRVFLNLDRTDDRKVKEILLSLRLERFLSKQQIITAYLNKVPFGNGSSGYNVFGIKAAAKGIFNENDLGKLNVAQAAYLAGLPQLPSSYSAYNGKGEFNEAGFKRAINRQHLVLSRMLEESKINKAQYDEAMAFDIKKSLAPRTVKAYNTYPYLMMETERQAAQALMSVTNPSQAANASADTKTKDDNDMLKEAEQQLRTGGYMVYTTIDKSVYKSMRQIAENKDNFSATSKTKGDEQAAAILIQHKTGAILGMMEGRDFQKEQMNYATQMVRQPGSAMKPIAAYLPALDSGLVQPGTIVDDAPIILKDGSNGYHIPKNANNRYQGLVTARYALNQSLNTIALKLFNEKVGINKAWAFAKKLGITTLEPSDNNAQTGVLGGLAHGVTVEELTNAYGAIPNGGVFNDAYMIEKIVDSQGNIVYKHQPNPVQAFTPQTAYLMTDMLRTAVSEGTGRLVKRNFNQSGKIPIAGKTGTTQSYTDVWFEGFTPDVTLGVWVGYKQPVNKLETKAQKERARRLWALIMNEVTAKDSQLFQTDSFKRPDGIVSRTASAYGSDIYNSKFLPKNSENGVTRAKYITYQGVNYIPRDGTPDDMLYERTVRKREKPISELIKELQQAFRVMRRHNSLSYYLPQDADKEAPTQIDPRKDDGAAPNAPSSVSVSYSDGKAIISFSPSGNSDVVGYRLYRSTDGGSFQRLGKVVMADGSKVFSDSPGGSSASYYVTAVDVGGHESGPSTQASAAPVVPPADSESPDIPGEGDGTGAQPTEVPTAPGQPQAKAAGTSVVLQWSAGKPADAITAYNVYYSESGAEPFKNIGSTANTSFEYKPGRKPKGWFRVTSMNTMGESAPSGAVRP